MAVSPDVLSVELTAREAKALARTARLICDVLRVESPNGLPRPLATAAAKLEDALLDSGERVS